jgi:hypothetical protein
MKHTNDITGLPICMGDYIAYTTRQSSDMETHIARVDDVLFDPNSDCDRYTLKVISVSKRWFRDGHKLVAYKTTLTANDTIVILSHVPNDIRNLVNEFRARPIK